MDSLPVTNDTVGKPESLRNKTLESGASAIQVNPIQRNLLVLLKFIRVSPQWNASAPT